MPKPTDKSASGTNALGLRDVPGWLANGTAQDNLEREYAEWSRELKRLERKIAEAGGHDLGTLQKAGVPRAEVLEFLALTTRSHGVLLGLMRSKRNRLRTLAARMDGFEQDLNDALRDPFMRMACWLYYEGFGSILGMEKPKAWTWGEADVSAFMVPSGMRVLARAFREEAKRFSRFLRKYGRADSQLAVAFLLLRVYMFRVTHEGEESRAGRRFVKLTPRRGPDHLDALARLLTDAFEAAGLNKYGKARAASRLNARRRSDKYFSAEGLSQVWKRTGVRMLAIWWKNSEKQPLQPSTKDAALPPIQAPILGRIRQKPARSDTSR